MLASAISVFTLVAGFVKSRAANTDQRAQHTIGNLAGAQFANEGEYNVNDPKWGTACTAGAIDSAIPKVCIQAAYEAACSPGQKFTSTPWVHIPPGTYTLGNNGPVWDCPNLTHVFGDGEFATTLVANGNFPVMQAIAPQTQTDSHLLTAANIATGGTANIAHN